MKTVRLKYYLFVTGVALFIGGCASTGSIQIKAPMTAKLTNYKTMLFHVSSQVPETSQEVLQLEIITIAKLRDKGLFEKVIAGSTSPDAQADLQLNAEIMKLKKVDAGARVIGGAFAGQAHMIVDVKLTDMKTGKSVGAFQAEGKSSGGSIFAGTTYQSVERVAEKIVEFVQKSM